jgi:hypothetical protein
MTTKTLYHVNNTQQVTRQQPVNTLLNNGVLGSGVFYAVYAEVIYEDTSRVES